MPIRRLPSAIVSATCGTRSLPSRDSSEHRSDGHPESRQMAFAKNVTCHDLSGREDICVRAQTLDFRSLIHLYAQIGESDSRPQRKTVEGRLVDGLCPVRFRRIDAFGAAVIQNLMIKEARPHCLIKFANAAFEFLRRQAEGRSKFCDTWRGDRRENRRHKAADDFRIENGIRDLIRLLGDQTSPDGIALGPKIFALIIETFGVPVDDDPSGKQSSRVTMPPSNLGARPSIATA